MHVAKTLLIGIFALVTITPAFAQNKVVDGEIGPGALYRLVRPSVWNGSLVVYAHGLLPVNQPIALPQEADLLVNSLPDSGFAVAYSSFSENGWAVKDGAQRTEQLLGIFKSKFGQPSRIYLVGGSMGGLIAIKLAETHPGQYDGMLPICAVAGGTKRELDYFGHVRTLFDYFYPGVLPGNAGFVDPTIDFNQAIVLPAINAMSFNPNGAIAIASIAQTPVPFALASPQELGQSIATALFLHASQFLDFPDRLHGHTFFDNRQTVYTGALPAWLLQDINANVRRFDASQSALNYFEQYYNPSGNLHTPTLMISTSRDPEVPSFNQTAYANAVSLRGNSNRLVSRFVDRYGHCNFQPGELQKAFTDLVLWVEAGIKPAP